MELTPFQDSLESGLLSARNSDGGWGYYPGKSSRLEPTCWALLALGDDWSDDAALRHWPARDGLLLERPGGEPNFAFHALALLTLRAREAEHEAGNAALLAALQRTKGVALPASTINRQDNSLQGWSWISDTFSWVEPTAWCLLALKKGAEVPRMNPERQARVAEAESLLIDRCCTAGGWNYGNSNMLGQELAPYVPTTAVALLALQDRRSEPAFQRSASWLDRHALSERSGSALALARIALRVLGRPIDALDTALAGQLPTTLAVNNHATMAQALFALRMDDELVLPDQLQTSNSKLQRSRMRNASGVLEVDVNSKLQTPNSKGARMRNASKKPGFERLWSLKSGVWS